MRKNRKIDVVRESGKLRREKKIEDMCGVREILRLEKEKKKKKKG